MYHSLIAPTSICDDLRGTVKGMAEEIYAGIPNRPRSASTSSEMDTNALDLALQPLSTVDSSRVSNYLKSQDGVFTGKLISIVRTTLTDVFKDNEISLADIPSLLQAVSQSCTLVNEVNEDTENMHLTSADIATLLQTLFTAVCILLLPQAQYALIIDVITGVFSIVRTQLVPLMKRKHLCEGMFAFCNM